MQKLRLSIVLALCMLLAVSAFATDATTGVQITAADATVAEGVADVVVTVDSGEIALSGVMFSVSAPEGVTLQSWTSSVEEAVVEDDTTTATTGWYISASDNQSRFGLINLTEDATLNETVTLTYAVAAEYAEDTAEITVTAIEAIKRDESAVDVTATGATITVKSEPACDHTNTEITYTYNDATHTGVCACGETVVENEEHTLETVADSAVAPSFTTAGKEADQACKCGYTVTGEEIPMLVAKAYIGETPYETVQDAVDAVAVVDGKLGTIVLEGAQTAEIDPKGKAFYLEGDISGITLVEGYEMDTSGRFVRDETTRKIITDPMIEYKPNRAFTIVRAIPTVVRDDFKNGINVSLESSLIMNYHTLKSTVASYAEFYVVIDLYDEAGNPVTSPEANASAIRMVITDNDTQSTQYEDRWMYSIHGVPAKCMNNKMVVTYYGIRTDGVVEYRTAERGFATYLAGIVGDGDTLLEKLAAEIMNYGAAAQTYFSNYNGDNLLNASLATGRQKNLLSDFTIELSNTSATTVPLKDGETKAFSAVGFALRLQDSVAPVIRPAVNSGVDYTKLTFVMEYDNIFGNAVDPIVIPGTEWVWSEQYGRPEIVVYELAAKDMREISTINFYENYGTENQKRVYQTYVRSVAESYALNGGVLADESLNTIAKAILTYGQAAKEYFLSK